MGSAAYNPDGEPSPLSSPLGPLSESPETESFMTLSPANLDDSLRYPGDNVPSAFDSLPRSPLLEQDHGLGPSGLDRIRSLPSSRVYTLPNMSASSIGALSPRTLSPSPRSLSTSRANSTAVSNSQDVDTLEDLHRFPSESLHSFSFAQQSDELLHNFMRDRFGWASNGSAIAGRMRGGTDTQAIVDLLSQSTISGREIPYSFAGTARGPMTGPADVGSDNVFERTFAELQPSLPEVKQAVPQPTQPQLSSSQQLPHEKKGLKSAPASRRVSLKRTFTDVNSTSQGQLIETLAQPYSAADPFSPLSTSTLGSVFPVHALHTHSSKWNPVSQAVFRTESKAPWTIIAANDLSCLVFGVTQAEVRKLSILEVVQEDQRQWLESKLRDPITDAATKVRPPPDKDKHRMKPGISRPMGMRNGVTAQLLSKPPSRARQSRRAQTDDGYGSSAYTARQLNHPATKSRGVLLCGDVVPIQKRNGAKGSASIWVMEKRGGLIWVLEEIQEDVAYISCDQSWRVTDICGASDKVWGQGMAATGKHITELLPHLPSHCLESSVEKGLGEIAQMKYFTARTSGAVCIPTTVSRGENPRSLQISSFPHVAGIMVLSASSLKIISSNSVFSSTLFGYQRPEGLNITDLIPGFDDYLYVISEEENIPLVDGVFIPELSFRRARTLSMLRDGKANVASVFLEPAGITARHRDGSTIAVDVQLRVAKSGTIFPKQREKESDTENDTDGGYEDAVTVTELVYALWVTFSRNIHTAGAPVRLPSPQYTVPLQGPSPSESATPTPLSVGSIATPRMGPDEPILKPRIPTSTLSQQLNEAASEPLIDKPVQPVPEMKPANAKEVSKKRTIADYVILEEMGQGAYGEVKLARLKKIPGKKVVLKYVTKKRILVDTWTRDRRLGTVPLEIHVLDYLRKDGLKHPNIVEMEGFFEDDINYYIEMQPHGLPGMDLFDYIELKTNMDEQECRNIFKQVVSAIHHLHTKALVVHRDIKDENVILDGEGRIKLIDFGSAAYIKNGPFDVFVGTIDYAAPEVLQGKSYRGKEQDIWALGILLYTIVYKENPFYNIDEILDHPLRVPFLPFSEECIDLIRKMLDRDVDNRLTIGEVIEHPWMID
ncbi:Pkinase-domain-containing protein [Aspergillus egyptiacus]|nr:Pkinase-domain-containing protein [Aspergillus egyptiacus]